MPTVATRFFLDLKEVRKLAPKTKKVTENGSGTDEPRIAFFAGCGVNYLMPQVGTSVVFTPVGQTSRNE